MNTALESLPIPTLVIISTIGVLMLIDTICWLVSQGYKKEYKKIDSNFPKILSLLILYPCMLFALYIMYHAFEYYIGFKWVETYALLLFLSLIVYGIREK